VFICGEQAFQPQGAIRGFPILSSTFAVERLSGKQHYWQIPKYFHNVERLKVMLANNLRFSSSEKAASTPEQLFEYYRFAFPICH
jgi:hypothetical protein